MFTTKNESRGPRHAANVDKAEQIPTLDLIVNPKGGPRDENIIPPIKLMDGTIICMFASRSHYCEPRDNTGPYTSVELTMSQEVEPGILRKYTHLDLDDPIRTYSYVPVAELEAFITWHGGIQKVYALNKTTLVWE